MIFYLVATGTERLFSHARANNFQKTMMLLLIHGPIQNYLQWKIYIFFCHSHSQSSKFFYASGELVHLLSLGLIRQMSSIFFFTLKSSAFTFSSFAFLIPSYFSDHLNLLSSLPHFLSLFFVPFILGTRSRSGVWCFIDCVFHEGYELPTYQY